MDILQDEKLIKMGLGVLESKKVAVIGCGGLGGYVLEMLARFGVGEITVVDDDIVDAENLNRQVMSGAASVGKYKVNESVLWIKQVNPFIYVKGVIERINKDNAIKILSDVDMVLDCVDNVETKFVLQSACEQLNIPLIHGAAEEWTGQVCTIFPKDRTLDKVYQGEMKNYKLKKPSLIPAAVASCQVAECIKFFLEKGELLRSKIMFIDAFNNKVELVNIE